MTPKDFRREPTDDKEASSFGEKGGFDEPTSPQARRKTASGEGLSFPNSFRLPIGVDDAKPSRTSRIGRSGEESLVECRTMRILGSRGSGRDIKVG